MKLLPVFVALLCLPFVLSAQNVQALKSIDPSEPDYENVDVVPLHSDSTSSTFIVFVKKTVAKHYHAHHTEQVVVLEGKGRMQMGDQEFIVKKGDYIIIPPGTHHAVQVIGRKPMKVLSIQSPQFKGKDRIFVDK